MNLFEFLLVFVSILLGLGITELLGGVVRILRGELPAGRLHTLWILIVFLVQAQLAWGLWLLRSMEEWRYSEFLLLLSGPIVLYMAAAVLFPATASSGSLDTHLMQRRRAFFLLMLAYVCFAALFELFLLHNSVELVPTVFRLLAASLLAALAISERRALHWVLALVVLASQLWFTYSYTFVLAASPAVQPGASVQ